jgi:hypothetical protein
LYHVQSTQQTGSQFRLLATIPYLDMLLREQKVYVYKRHR